jgi:FMN phosphatase YigB (HAD superfamily)
MVKAVFFDIGGTLFNSDSVGSSKYVVAAKAVINYLKKHNINLKVTPEKLAVD